MAKRWHNPFLRYPTWSLLVVIVGLIPLWAGLRGFHISSDHRELLEADQRNLNAYEKVREVLAGVEVVLISMEVPDVFSPEGIEAIRRVSEAFARTVGVQDVKSLTHSVKPVRRGFSFEMVPLVSQQPSQAELDALRQFALEHPLIRDVMVAGDSRHTLITLTYERDLSGARAQEELRAEIDALLAPFEREGLRFAVLGLPLVEHEIRSTFVSDMRTLAPAAGVVVLGLLWAAFRSWRMLLLIVGNHLVAMAAVCGTIELVGIGVDVFSVTVFPLVAGVHLTLLAHLFTAYQREALAGWNTAETIGRALRQVLKPSVFAAITTGTGLLSLQLSDVRQIREFGAVGAIGVAWAFAMTFGPGVAAMRLCLGKGGMGAVTVSTELGSNERWSVRLQRFTLGRRRAMIIAAVCACVIAAIGAARMRTDIRAVEFLPAASETRRSVEQLDRIYGGINVVQIRFDSGRENGINDLEFLRYLKEVQEQAARHEGVSGAYSYAQLMAMIHQIWENSQELALPQNPLLMHLFVFALKSQNFPFLTALADPEFRTAYLVVRSRDMPADEYLSVLNEIVQFAEEKKPDYVTISAAEGMHSILAADRRIMESQLRSAGATLLVIGVLLAVLWRSVRLAFYVLLVNAIPVALALSISGYAGLALNSITAMIGAIAFAVAVDDSIHFITHWIDARRGGADFAEAIRLSFEAKRRAILLTSAIMIALFLVFTFSSFPPVGHFALLSAAAFFFGVISVLLLLPALLGAGREELRA